MNPLREARLNVGISQEDLQQLTGVAQTRISKYERGAIGMAEPTAFALASALRIPTEELAPIIRNVGKPRKEENGRL